MEYLPLHYQEGSDAYTHVIRDSDDGFVCQLRQNSNGESEAMARRMVQCWGSHDDLLAALQKLIPLHDATGNTALADEARSLLTRASSWGSWL